MFWCSEVFSPWAWAGVGPQLRPPCQRTDRAAIRESSEKFAQDVLKKDYAAAASLYTDDAVLMQPNGPAVTGRAAIQQWMEGLPPVSAFTVNAQGMESAGELAHVWGSYALTMTPPGPPGPVNEAGKYLEIRHKQADGSWKITRDIWNSDTPLP